MTPLMGRTIVCRETIFWLHGQLRGITDTPHQGEPGQPSRAQALHTLWTCPGEPRQVSYGFPLLAQPCHVPAYPIHGRHAPRRPDLGENRREITPQLSPVEIGVGGGMAWLPRRFRRGTAPLRPDLRREALGEDAPGELAGAQINRPPAARVLARVALPMLDHRAGWPCGCRRGIPRNPVAAATEQPRRLGGDLAPHCHTSLASIPNDEISRTPVRPDGRRGAVRRGAMVVPPFVAATLVFALGIVAVIVTDVSPLHLLWWFPCSFIIGLVALVFPLGTHLLLRFLVLLVGPIEGSVLPQPQAGRDAQGSRGQSKPRHAPRTLRRTKASRRRGLR